MEDNINTIAYRLYTTRKSKKITQTQLAKLCGVSRQTIYEYEKGFYIPKLDNAGKLAKVLGVTLDYLCYGITKQEQEKPSRTYLNSYKDLMKSFIHLQNSLLFTTTLKDGELSLTTSDTNFVKLYSLVQNVNYIADSLQPNTYNAALDELLNSFDVPESK